jgi:hypothetical protein
MLTVLEAFGWRFKMETISETIFLLGAGFTKAAINHAPLNQELLDQIANNGGSTLLKYKVIFDTNDIEKLLTYLDLEVAQNNEKNNDRAIIDSEISRFFSRYRISAFDSDILPWIKKFALVILNQNDAIISLNYDCFLEGALDKLGVWSVNGGYARINNPLSGSIPINPKNIKIYKIHGSENFVKSDSIGKNRKQTGIGFEINPSIYPISGAHFNFGGGALNPRPYIIAPSFVKIPHVEIAAMMIDLIEVVRTVKNFVMIGCGMRSEDNFLWLLLTRFLNNKIDQPRRLVILNPSADDIRKKISNYWIGDISRYCNVVTIPCGMEDGISSLEMTLKNKNYPPDGPICP